MAGTSPKLTTEQRDQLDIWLAADYSDRLILHWMAERGWPKLTQQGVNWHRQQRAAEIEQLRTERRSKALTTGLALKDERVERLKQHADRLEEIKWQPDEKGKLHNEKAWRETVDDIAREMGGRKTGVDVNLGGLPDEELVERTLELLARVRAAGLDLTAAEEPAE